LPLSGNHNFKNYICPILAPTKEDITIEQSIDSLKKFRGVKRRINLVPDISNIKVYDNFAHHPTPIKISSNSIKDKYPTKKILGIVELGSNTISSGYHKNNLIKSLKILDKTLLLNHNNAYDYLNRFDSEEKMLDSIRTEILEYDIILIMTNKDPQKFIKPILDSLENPC
jgi:UDP-N-acetylmuramate-alanine ligase